MKQKLLNKLWLRVGMIVAIMTTALAGTVKADTESVTFSSQGYSNGDLVSSYTGTKLNITFTDGSTATAYYSTGTGIRLYGGGSATFSVNNATITKVALTFSGDSNAPGDTNVWSCTGGSGSGTSGASATWTGSAESVTIARATGSGHWRLQVVTVTYTTSGGGGGDTPTPSEGTGTINFGSAAGCTAINAASVTGNDDLSNTWTITTEGTTSFTANTAYYQVGSGSKPATSITFTTTLASELNITAMSAKFGGFSGTAGTVTLKVGDTTVGTGSLNGTSDVTVASTSAAAGTVLTVTVTGIAKGVKCYYISYTCTSSTDPTCETPTFSPAAGTYTSAQNVTISTETEGATIYYTTDGTDPTTSSTQYSGAINVSSTTTIKAIAAAEDHNNSSVASATYNIVPLEHAGTQADPYTVADAFTAIDANAGITGVYVSGIVCTAANSLTNNKYLTYYISDDGTTTNKLEAYHGLGIGGADFTSADDIQVGDKVVIYGNLKKYNSTYEFDADNQLVSIVHPASITVASTTIDASCEVNNGTINVTYENFTTVLSEVIFCDANGSDATYDWITAVINNENNVEYHLNENTGEARTAYMKVYALDNEANELYSELITINQAAYVAPPTPVSGKYVKVTSTDDLTDGQYLIVYEADNVAFNGGLETLDAVGNTIAVTISNNEIAATSTTTAAEFTIDVTAGTIKSASGEYIFASTYNNELRTSTSVPENTNTFSFNSGDAVISVAVTETQSVTLKYNSASNQTRFRYYKSGQQAIQLYKKVVPTESVTLNTYGYATFSSNNAVSIPADGAFTAWQITNVDSENNITFEQVTGDVKAKTGLFLKGDASDEVTIDVAASGNELDDNLLVGFPNATNVANGEYYGLSGSQFVKVNAGAVKAGKALLPAGLVTETSGGAVKAFTFVFEDDATGIEETLSNSPLKGENIYNLAGQMVNGKSVNGKLPKGIYIVNGKKVMVK